MEQKLAFIHIPKCGGTSVGLAIRALYTHRRVHRLNSSACSLASNCVGYQNNMEYTTLVASYFLADKKFSFVWGHFALGQSFIETFGEVCQFITVLRHPVDRWFSHFFYNKYKTHSQRFKIEEDLEDHVSSRTAFRMGRLYIRMLADADIYAELTPNILKAKEALTRLSLVGFTEDLPTFSERFSARFGTPPLTLEHQHGNPLSKEEQASQITPAIKAKVETLCEPDLEVYDYARRFWA